MRDLFTEVFGGEPLAPADGGWYAQLVAHKVPGQGRPLLQRRLYDEHRVEIPVADQNGTWFIRASIQAYNDDADIQRLEVALRDVWPSVREHS